MKRITLIPWVLLAGTGAACVYEYTCFRSAESTLRTKSTQIQQMSANAAQITQLKGKPRRATDRQLPHEQLVLQLEQACRRAELPVQNLASVWPESPKRVHNSDYQELITRVTLEHTTLQQLAKFAYSLREQDTSLTITELRLSPEKDDPARWNAESGIHYLIFSPADRKPGAP